MVLPVKKDLTEEVMDHLDGYMGNKPVRIGNQASEHIQNDIYGQVSDIIIARYILITGLFTVNVKILTSGSIHFWIR
jgi:GH15 family glucan-1,4-alpha-glucosidase